MIQPYRNLIKYMLMIKKVDAKEHTLKLYTFLIRFLKLLLYQLKDIFIQI